MARGKLSSEVGSLLRVWIRHASTTAVRLDMFKCSVCEISATSEKDLQAHLHGRKHLRGLDKLKAFEKSVFIRGFPGTTSSDTLQKFLEEEVGGVNSVYLKAPPNNQEYKYALVEFCDPADALKALQIPKLSLAGKKLTIKPKILPNKKIQSPGDVASPQKEATGSESMQGVLNDSDILQFSEIKGQLKHLTEMNKMSLSDIETHLEVTFKFLQEFRAVSPQCVLIPFGSAISGMGTKHSDLDLCLIPTPPQTLVEALAGSNYFSHSVLSIVKNLEKKYGITMFPPSLDVGVTPESDVGVVSEAMAGSSGSSSPLPPHAIRSKSGEITFKSLSRMIRSMEDCSQVLAIAHARCPIIRFCHTPTQLECDICMDNILGAFNTALVRAYCKFDQRLAILGTFVKLWTRERAIPRIRLNSYAQSLMVIYFLQRVSPPVLPCLQQTEGWPKNLKRYKGSPLQVKKVWSKLIAPWDVGFASPQSLLPSTNTDSPASLLLKFFKFYAEEFNYDEHVISIKTNSRELLSRAMALQQVYDKGGFPSLNSFYVSPLVVQDPFDLEHNVTKAVDMSLLKSLCREFALARDVLQMELDKKYGTKSLLALFDPPKVPAGRSMLAISLDFTLQHVAGLLVLPPGRAQHLAKHLHMLDLSNPKVRGGLSYIVLREVVSLLEMRYGFTCHEQGEVEGEMDEDAMEEGGSSLAVGDALKEGSGLFMTSSMCAENSDVPISAHGERKRRRSDGEELGVEQEFLSDSKHHKMQGGALDMYEENTALQLLQSLLPSRPHPHSYLCTVFENTWLHARRKRRKLHPTPRDVGGMQGQGEMVQTPQYMGGEGHETQTAEIEEESAESLAMDSPSDIVPPEHERNPLGEGVPPELKRNPLQSLGESVPPELERNPLQSLGESVPPELEGNPLGEGVSPEHERNPLQSLGESLPSVPPVLQLQLKLSPFSRAHQADRDTCLYVLEIKKTKGQERDFLTLLAILKKILFTKTADPSINK